MFSMTIPLFPKVISFIIICEKITVNLKYILTNKTVTDIVTVLNVIKNVTEGKSKQPYYAWQAGKEYYEYKRT